MTIVHLTTAIELKPVDRRAVIKLLNGKTAEHLVLETTVDSSLIGGVIIRHGNQIADYSLKVRLDQFRQQWRAATSKPTK